MTVREFAAYSLDALRAIARYHALAVEDEADRTALASRLSEHLSSRQAVLGALDKLAPHHRLTLERLQLRGGHATTRALQLELVSSGHLEASPGGRYSSYEGSPERPGSRYFEDVIARLATLGLVLTSDLGYYRMGRGIELGQPGRHVFVPEAVLRHLPPPRPLGPPEEIARVREGDASAFRRDAFLYWSYAQHNEVTVIARGTVAKRHFVRIAQSLLVPEEAESAQAEEELGRTYLLRRLLQDLGVLEVAGNRLRPGPRAAEFLALPDAEQTRRLYEAWLASRRWNEIARLPEFREGSLAEQPAPPALVAGRQFLARLLADAPAGQWIGLDEFVARVRRDHYEFLIPRRTERGRRIDGIYGSHNRNPLGLSLYDHDVPDETVGWELIERAFVYQVVTEALHWLGLVSLGYEADGRLAACRLTQVGRRLIRGEPATEEAPDGKPLVAQADFQVFAYQHTPTSVLAALESCAERVRVGPVFEYRLTRDSVYRAREQGYSADRIAALLDAHSATPLPQNVRQSLADWQREQERIVVRRGVSLLHAADPALLDALLTAPELTGKLGRRLAPDALEVRPGVDAGTLAGALAARGELLAVDRPSGLPRPVLVVEPSGRVDFGGKLPSIHLWRRLAAFAQQRDGALWVNPEGLRRAAEAGLTADEILKVLRAHSRAALPPEVEETIVAGTQRWGEVALATVALVQVEDGEILKRLLAEPTLRGLLWPLRGQTTVAVARPENIGRVREALGALRITPTGVVH